MTRNSFVAEVAFNVISYASFVRSITANFQLVLILKIFENDRHNCILIT